MSGLTEGVAAACEKISKEDEAKKAWLARLDMPAWQGKVAPTKHKVKAA